MGTQRVNTRAWERLLTDKPLSDENLLVNLHPIKVITRWDVRSPSYKTFNHTPLVVASMEQSFLRQIDGDVYLLTIA